MKIRIYLLTLFIILLTSLTSVLLLFFYMDIESNFKIAIGSMFIASFLFLSSILTLLIFFLKKIYYRWEVYISNLNSSLRQSILLTSFILWLLLFNATWIFNWATASLLFLVMLFLELVFQSILE